MKRIDPHVHFRDEEQNYKETIKHGLSLAEEQGVSYVFDMPNIANPIITEEDVKRRLNLVPETKKDKYFLYIGGTKDEEQLKNAINIVNNYKQVIGIKIFAGKSTGDLATIEEESQKKIYKTLAENDYRGVLAVHCEKESYMKDEFNPQNPITHATSRPREAEIESIKDQINFAKEVGFKGNLHIVHVSCKDSLSLIKEAKNEMNITCAATPHHILWDETKLDSDHGLLYKMNPPLRKKEDVEAVRQALKDGTIDWIETDHAPHAIGEKLYSGHPSGFPSLYLYKYLVEEFLPSLEIDESRIQDLTYNNIIKAFGDIHGTE